jgi:hypothetical protein
MNATADVAFPPGAVRASEWTEWDGDMLRVFYGLAHRVWAATSGPHFPSSDVWSVIPAAL